MKSHLLLLHNGSNIFVRDFCQWFLSSALEGRLAVAVSARAWHRVPWDVRPRVSVGRWPGGPRALPLARRGPLGVRRLRGRPRLAAREGSRERRPYGGGRGALAA